MRKSCGCVVSGYSCQGEEASSRSAARVCPAGDTGFEQRQEGENDNSCSCAAGLLVVGLLLGMVFANKDNGGTVSSEQSQSMDAYGQDGSDPAQFEAQTEYDPAEDSYSSYEEDEFQFDSEIHRYSYHVADLRWIEAAQDALMRGGYLVHIDSQAEMDYIVRELTALGYEKKQFMIGGSAQ